MRWTWPALGVLALAAVGRAHADDGITVDAVTAPPGASDVAVTLSATTSTPLTGVNVDITFDRRLCDAIADERLEQAGRARIAPLEGGTRCPAEGRVSIVLLDVTEQPGETVVAPGAGPVARWVFSIKEGAPLGASPLNLTVVAARNGFDAVALPAMGGRLTIGAAAPCAGDCNHDGMVAINELITGVNIALGSAPVSSCPSFDANADGMVTINELISAVNAALNGC